MELPSFVLAWYLVRKFNAWCNVVPSASHTLEQIMTWSKQTFWRYLKVELKLSHFSYDVSHIVEKLKASCFFLSFYGTDWWERTSSPTVVIRQRRNQEEKYQKIKEEKRKWEIRTLTSAIQWSCQSPWSLNQEKEEQILAIKTEAQNVRGDRV